MRFFIVYGTAFADAQRTAFHVADNTTDILGSLDGTGIDEIIQDRSFHGILTIRLLCIANEPAGILLSFYFQGTGDIPHLGVYSVTNQSSCIISTKNGCAIGASNEIQMSNDGSVGIAEKTGSSIVFTVIHRQAKNIVSQAVKFSSERILVCSQRCLVQVGQINGIAQGIMTIQSIIASLFTNLRQFFSRFDPPIGEILGQCFISIDRILCFAVSSFDRICFGQICFSDITEINFLFPSGTFPIGAAQYDIVEAIIRFGVGVIAFCVITNGDDVNIRRIRTGLHRRCLQPVHINDDAFAFKSDFVCRHVAQGHQFGVV